MKTEFHTPAAPLNLTLDVVELRSAADGAHAVEAADDIIIVLCCCCGGVDSSALTEAEASA